MHVWLRQESSHATPAKSLSGRIQNTTNREEIDFGTVSRHPGTSRCVPGASRTVPGAPKARPRTAPGATRSSPAHPKCRPGAPRSVPRRTTSTPHSCPGAKTSSFFARRVHEAWSERVFVDFCPFSFFLQSLRTLQSTAAASKNRGSAMRAARRVACATQTRKTPKIDPQIDPNSPKIAKKGTRCLDNCRK